MTETNIQFEQKEFKRPTLDPLTESTAVLYEIAGMVDDLYLEKGVDLKTVNPSEYWMKVAELGRSMVRREYATIDTLTEGAAVELTSAIPYFLLAQQRLTHHDHHGSSEQYNRDDIHDDVYYVSYFNSRLREYAWANPSVTTHELNAHVMAVATKSEVVKHPERLQRVVADVIRGAQHETAFAAILQKVGTARSAGHEEDLHGIDYVLKVDHDSFGVDVKSSPNSILHASHGDSRDCAVVRRKLMVYSQLDDDDLRGRFFVDDDVAIQKATHLSPLIRSAIAHGGLRRVEF